MRDSVALLSAAGGVIASIVVAFSVLWVGAMDGVGFHETGPLFQLSGLPVSIGLYGFCYSGHAVFPNIYSSLRNRNDYNKVLGVRCVFNILQTGFRSWSRSDYLALRWLFPYYQWRTTLFLFFAYWSDVNIRHER